MLKSKTMWYYVIKVAVSAIIIVIVSEISKRNPTAGGILASLPLVSLLAIIWLYTDTRDEKQVISLSYNIFWLVIPSLSFFLLFPFLLKQNINFYL